MEIFERKLKHLGSLIFHDLDLKALSQKNGLQNIFLFLSTLGESNEDFISHN